ncbi:hypothetical protein [Tenacibaculum sp. M341]|uniref:hypothetical protein n=1 Tax=Tenacibaculum sp. M341 TaxID=2530339 RepID=UPI001042BB9B|nr:hypothetical protein [Tenacibaculum sp. M341]TCI90119.1 hypothetical protein EYW44_14370 [Tenacibaculum sp. M341]
MTDNDRDKNYDEAYIVSYKLGKDNSLQGIYHNEPKILSYEVSTLVTPKEFTGKVMLNDDRNFIISTVDEENLESELLIMTEIF